MPKRKIRRYPFSSLIAEDVQDELGRHYRKTGESIVDFLDRNFRKGLGMPPRPKEDKTRRAG